MVNMKKKINGNSSFEEKKTKDLVYLTSWQPINARRFLKQDILRKKKRNVK